MTATLPLASQGQGLQITDAGNRPASDPSAPFVKNATVVPLSFPIGLVCAPSPDPSVGSSCSVQTTVNTVAPGAVVAGKRAIWELGQLQILDQGPNGVPGDSDDRPFEVQGVFVP
jgi:hypothetical protein